MRCLSIVVWETFLFPHVYVQVSYKLDAECYIPATLNDLKLWHTFNVSIESMYTKMSD